MVKTLRYWAVLKSSNCNRRSDWIGWQYLTEHRCICGTVGCSNQGVCHCGCGGVTEASVKTAHSTTPPCTISGLPARFLPGHRLTVGIRKGSKNASVVAEMVRRAADHRCICGTVDCKHYGLCHCGCGGVPEVAAATRVGPDGARITFSGEPVRYCKGHSPNIAPGEASPNFAGHRRFQPSRGYWYVYAPDHPKARGGRVEEHVLLAEKRLARYLLYYGKNNGDNEVVHHANGNKADNRIDNLVVMSAREHVSLHRNLKLIA